MLQTVSLLSDSDDPTLDGLSDSDVEVQVTRPRPPRVTPPSVTPSTRKRPRSTAVIDLTDEKTAERVLPTTTTTSRAARIGTQSGDAENSVDADVIICKPSSENANEAVIKRLRRKLQCSICQETIQELASTKCGHLFCFQCVRQALRYQKKCPQCRAKLLSRDVHRVYF